MLCDIFAESSLTSPKIKILTYITCVIIPNDSPSSFPHLYFPIILLRRSNWAQTISKRPSEAVKLDNCLPPLTCLSILLREGLRCCAPPPSDGTRQISGAADSEAVRCHWPIQEVEHPEQTASRWPLMAWCLSFIVIQRHAVWKRRKSHFNNLPILGEKMPWDKLPHTICSEVNG